jgi:hypothetical protein
MIATADDVERTYRDLVLERYDHIDQVPITEQHVLRALAIELNTDPLSPTRIAALLGSVKAPRHASASGGGHYDFSTAPHDVLAEHCAIMERHEAFVASYWKPGPEPEPTAEQQLIVELQRNLRIANHECARLNSLLMSAKNEADVARRLREQAQAEARLWRERAEAKAPDVEPLTIEGEMVRPALPAPHSNGSSNIVRLSDDPEANRMAVDVPLWARYPT